jgi:hypothetical protein
LSVPFVSGAAGRRRTGDGALFSLLDAIDARTEMKVTVRAAVAGRRRLRALLPQKRQPFLLVVPAKAGTHRAANCEIQKNGTAPKPRR